MPCGALYRDTYTVYVIQAVDRTAYYRYEICYGITVLMVVMLSGLLFALSGAVPTEEFRSGHSRR
jgi:hypothetical protein